MPSIFLSHSSADKEKYVKIVAIQYIMMNTHLSLE